MLQLFNLSLRISGFPIKRSHEELMKNLSLSAHDYEIFLKSKKEEIVNFHLKNNSFYKSFCNIESFSQWENLPVMQKKDMQKPLHDRLSETYNLKNVYINKTSGSSGDPFVFAKDKFCHALTWSSIMYRFGWFTINFNTSYQARFYGIPLDFIGNTKERFKDLLSKRYRFNVFDLSDEALEIVLEQFKSKKFDYINGYTSAIVVFAKFLQKKGVVLKTVCPTLKACVVTSEMLFDDDKKLLEVQFGIPTINEYGASELDLIAFQNTNGDWQINAETLFVEILDENNTILPYGQEGRIVITSLYNKAHPFIRYDIGDIGILDEKSTSKKPILKKLIGRTNDIVMLPSGKKSPGLTFYYITKSIIEDDGNVAVFIIKQTKIDTFDIEYVSKEELKQVQIKAIESAIENYLEKGLLINFVRKETLERSKSGKLKQFVSLINKS